MLRCTGHATRPADTPTSLFLLPHAPSYSLRYRRTKLSRVVGCCCPFVPVVWLLNGSEEEKTTTKESLSFLRLQSRRRPSRERERADGWARIQIHDAPSSSSSAPSGSHPLTSFRPDKKMYKTRGKEKKKKNKSRRSMKCAQQSREFAPLARVCARYTSRRIETESRDFDTHRAHNPWQSFPLLLRSFAQR